jgi:hypothetical protein
MIRVVSPPPLLSSVRSSHDGHRLLVHYHKGVRGYRAIARRRRRGRRRRRPAVPPLGRCAAWVQLPRSAAPSARLSTRTAGPEIFSSQRHCLRGGSSRTCSPWTAPGESLPLMLQVEPDGVPLSVPPSPRRPDGPLCGPHHACVVRGGAPPHVAGRHFGVEPPNVV